MRLRPTNSRFALPASRSGVALVITIVLLSVITFLTIAFLALMGRERGAVKTTIAQTIHGVVPRKFTDPVARPSRLPFMGSFRDFLPRGPKTIPSLAGRYCTWLDSVKNSLRRIRYGEARR